MDIGQADKSQRRTQAGIVEIHRLGRLRAVDPATWGKDEDFLVPQHTLEAFVGVAEGDASARNVIDPGSHGRAHRKLVHGGTYHNDIRSKQLGDQSTRETTKVFLRRATPIFWGEKSTHHDFIKMRYRAGGRIMIYHDRTRMYEFEFVQ